jgi:multidrug efflux pump subunit AcrA (membrane-fusion protein)
MKKSIIIGIVVMLVIVVVVQFFLRENGNDLELAQVVLGDIVQEVSETGQVKKGEKIKLNFRSSGIIEDIAVNVGQEVEQNEFLARLDNSELVIQITEAQASLDLNKAELNKLLAGATQEEIQIAQTNLQNSETALDNAKKALTDIKAQGQDDLGSAYEDALNVLDDSYIAVSSAKNKSESIESTYFTLNDQEGFSVRESVDRIQGALSTVKVYVDAAKASASASDIDIALSQMKDALQKTSDALREVREMTDTSNYKNTVTSADKTVLDTERDSINTALTSTVNSQQTIATTKIDNTANNNTYQAQVDSAQGDFNYYQNQLSKLIAPPRREDVDLYEAKVRQAQAKVNLLNEQK